MVSSSSGLKAGPSRAFTFSSIWLTRLAHALQPFSEAQWDVTVVRMRDLTVGPCEGCEHCRSHANVGGCVAGCLLPPGMAL